MDLQDAEDLSLVGKVQFFVTGPTDAAGKPIQFYYRACRKVLHVLNHGLFEFLRQSQGVKHFARNQRLRVEIPD